MLTIAKYITQFSKMKYSAKMTATVPVCRDFQALLKKLKSKLGLKREVRTTSLIYAQSASFQQELL